MMATFSDAFRAWRRNVKATLPYVRRREYRILQRKYDEVIDGLGWTASQDEIGRAHV